MSTGGVYGDINSRADFHAVVDKAIKEGKALLAKRLQVRGLAETQRADREKAEAGRAKKEGRR